MGPSDSHPASRLNRDIKRNTEVKEMEHFEQFFIAFCVV